MSWTPTPEKVFMWSRSRTLWPELILVRSASRMTVSTVTGSSPSHPSSRAADAGGVQSGSRSSSGCTSMEKTSEDNEDFLERDTEM